MSKPARAAYPVALHEGIAHRGHVCTSPTRGGSGFVGFTAPATWRDQLPVVDRKRSVVQLFPAEPGRPLQPEWRVAGRSWPRSRHARIRRCASSQAFAPRCQRPAQPGVMRPCGVTQVISGEYQTGAAQCTRAEVHEMKIIRLAVPCAVGRHRRNHDAVDKRHIANRNGRNIGGTAFAVLCPARLRQPALHARQPVAVAQTQVLVADPLAAGQQADRRIAPAPDARSERRSRTISVELRAAD